MSIDRTELRKGLAETQQYLLSHHEESEWYRCYVLDVAGRRVRICARCLGIYPGIVAGLLAYLTAPSAIPAVYLVGLSPLPALFDWALTSFTERRGYNGVRTVTGALLGYGYGLGLGLLLGETEMRVLVVGAAYALVACTLLLLERQGVPDT